MWRMLDQTYPMREMFSYLEQKRRYDVIKGTCLCCAPEAHGGIKWVKQKVKLTQIWF